MTPSPHNQPVHQNGATPVDGHSQIVYFEAHDNEQAATLFEFWAGGITVNDIMSDNGSNFRSKLFADALTEQAIQHLLQPHYG